MGKHRKRKTTNSVAQDAAKNHPEALLRDDLTDAASGETEEVKEETLEPKKTEDGTVDNSEEMTEEVDFSYVDMSKCSGQKYTVTKAMKRYTDAVFNIWPREDKQTILLVGIKGAGKHTIINYLSDRIKNKNCPEIFREQKSAIYMVDADEIASSLKHFVTAINKTIEAAMESGVRHLIVYVDRAERGMDLFQGMYDEIIEALEYEELESFKMLITMDDGKLVTMDEEQTMVQFFTESVVVIKVFPEERPTIAMQILKPRIEEYEDLHGVKLPQDVLEVLFMIYYGRNFCEDYSLGGFMIEVDAFLAMVKVSGKSVADRSDIKKYFRRSFEIMEKLSKDYNFVTAVHECGHVLVALLIPRLYTLYGASILYDTQNCYEGITLVKRTEYMSCEEEDIINIAAMLLAGRAAELEFCVKNKKKGAFIHKRMMVNRGSSSDLHEATEILREWVIQNGAYRFTGYNMWCENEGKVSVTDEIKINILVKWLLERAFKRATQYIRRHRTFMQEMHTFLLENMTATNVDIRAIAERTMK